MNYVRTILITIALLNMHYTYNGQIPKSSDDTIDALLESMPAAEPVAETKETNPFQKWTDHLALLTNNDEYWDAAENIPTPDWKTKAFDLAEEVIEHDKSLADSLTTSFIDALNAKKITDIKNILALIDEFKTFIANQVAIMSSKNIQETKESTPPVEIVPEVIAPQVAEPATEETPAQTETSETISAAEGGTTSTTSGQNDQEPNQDQLERTWNNLLERLKTEGINWVQIDDILNQTYQAAKELLKLGKTKENTLQTQFHVALTQRAENKAVSQEGKLQELFPLNIQETLSFFNNAIGASSSQDQFNQPYRYPEPSTFEPISPDQPQQGAVAVTDERVAKLQKELDEKEAKFKAEQKKAEEDRMKISAAAQAALEKQALTEEQVRRLTEAQNTTAEAQKKLKEEYELKRKQDLEEIEKARKSIMNYTEQLAASQKAESEKGLLSAFTQGLSDWWYGTSAQKPGALSSPKQEELLNMMVKDVPHHLQPAAKKAFTDFQNTLLNFNKDPFWDNQQSLPNITWIAQMDKLIKKVVITYKLMKKEDLADFVQNILQKSGKISPAALTNIMSKIQTKTNQALAEEKHAIAMEQQKVLRKQEKKEQVLLAQQRAKAEKEQILLAEQRAKAEAERIEAEKQKRIASAHTYRQEKKQWYDLLDKVAQNKQATAQENHAHLQEALQKSQSLLQLAGDIPHKNKSALSQKLKQKFSVALLEQQKSGDGLVNVHHHMDLFNNEINKMLD
jgi:hypothetical protein